MTKSPLKGGLKRAAGHITQDTTWSDDIVYVDGDVIIDNGITLTIVPGVVLFSWDIIALRSWEGSWPSASPAG